MASLYKSEVYIPVQRDSLSFQERHWNQWKGVEERMEERRKQWQEELDKMRQDLFVLKPADKAPSSPGLAPLQALTSFFDTDSEGRQVFRIRFEVSDFQPEEVTVKVEGRKLMVQARHEEETAQTSISKQYSRQVDIPTGVEEDKLSCTLSKDGVLTVEAPVIHSALSGPRTTLLPLQTVPFISFPSSPTSPSAASPTLTTSSSCATATTTTTTNTSSTSTTLMTGNNNTTTNSSIISSSSGSPGRYLGVATPVKNAIVTEADGSRRMVLRVDVGDFLPEEVVVKTADRKLLISAQHEERSAGRTMHKEFNKEYDLPESVDPSTIMAHLSEDKQLIIEAPIKTVVQRKVYELRQTQDVQTRVLNKDSCVTIADSHQHPVVTISVHRK